MRVLVIPDIHLHSEIFHIADAVPDTEYETIVCLGDVADSHESDITIKNYEKTFAAALMYAKKYKGNVYWCYGNHDISYLYYSIGMPLTETGFNYWAGNATEQFLKDLKSILGDKLAIAHIIDGAVFSHAGITEAFINNAFGKMALSRDIKSIIGSINLLVDPDCIYMLWNEGSPIWARPQLKKEKMLKDCFQIVGHTPVPEPILTGDVLSLDTYSPEEGNHGIYIVDTISKSYFLANS